MKDAKRYHRIKRALLFTGLGINLSALAFFQFSGLSAVLKNTTTQVFSGKLLHDSAYLVCFFTALTLLSLPVEFFSGFAVEKRFKQSNQTLAAWFWDRLKEYGLSLVLFLFAVEFFFLLIVKFPKSWWFLAGAGWLALSALLSCILPTILVPIFYKTKALPPGELKERLVELCRKNHLRALEVYEIALSQKTQKANAALVGMGKTRRILLGDTLIRNFAVEEIEMVVAHELGHQVKKHIAKSLFFNGVIVFSGLYLLYRLSASVIGAFGGGGLTDLAIFPALVLLASWAALLILPLQNAFSRHLETKADQFALSLFPSRDIFNSTMKKLGTQNLADAQPHPAIEFLLHDHPSLARRMRQASLFLDEIERRGA